MYLMWIVFSRCCDHFAGEMFFWYVTRGKFSSYFGDLGDGRGPHPLALVCVFADPMQL